jgi:alpha-galactosidase
MKALADYVHGKGLKLGIYSSPGTVTCARYTASWQHEQQDADTYAKWGVDYLKYDWCSYAWIVPKPTVSDRIKPYRVMRTALDRCHRDILFSFCQYGLGNVWEWGAATGGNCWRTTGDIVDNWHSMSTIGFGQAGHERYAGPGHWNDPDMLVVGKVGWGPSLHNTRLKPNEQLTHITLWSLLAAPLLIGCDMTRMDDFTRALLTNSEVLAVNQDPLGKQAWPVKKADPIEVWARPLADGAWAVGLFNRGPLPAKVKVTWADLKLDGLQPVRDLWQQKDLGSFADGFEAATPPHGAVLVKVGQPKE